MNAYVVQGRKCWIVHFEVGELVVGVKCFRCEEEAQATLTRLGYKRTHRLRRRGGQAWTTDTNGPTKALS